MQNQYLAVPAQHIVSIQITLQPTLLNVPRLSLPLLVQIRLLRLRYLRNLAFQGILGIGLFKMGQTHTTSVPNQIVMFLPLTQGGGGGVEKRPLIGRLEDRVHADGEGLLFTVWLYIIVRFRGRTEYFMALNSLCLLRNRRNRCRCGVIMRYTIGIFL